MEANEEQESERAKTLHILVVLLYWYPYCGPHTPIYAGLFRTLRERGHKITIITSFPHFRSGSPETWPEFRGKLFQHTNWEGMELIRTYVFAPVFKSKKIALICRALNFLSFNLSSTFVGILWGGKPDIILTLSSPPLTNGLVGRFLGKVKRAPCVYNMLDIYPDMAEKMGIWKNPMVMNILKRIERLVYKLSDGIVVLSESMRKNLLQKGIENKKIEVIPDFIDTKNIYPKKKDNDFARKYNLNNHFVAMYAGNVGIPHGVEVVIEAADLLRNRRNILFCIVGRGEYKDKLVNLVQEKGLQNVVFPPRQPEEVVPDIWASADVSLVTYRKGLAECSVPSKLLYIMASGRPVIVAADEDSEACYIVKDSGCGINVAPEEPKAISEAIIYLFDHPEIRKEMGQRGFEYIKAHFQKKSVADKFEQFFFKLSRQETWK